MGSKADPKEAIVSYLGLQNRPYSANDITQNLHKEFGKTAIQKALDELASNGLIKEKIYGKQKVYAPLQGDFDQSTMNGVLEELDGKISEASINLNKAEQELKTVENDLKEFGNQVTTEEAISQKETLTLLIAKLQSKLHELSRNEVKISEEDRKKLMNDKDSVEKEYRKRKRICMDVASAILENYPKSKKIFFEEVGIETDESLKG